MPDIVAVSPDLSIAAPIIRDFEGALDRPITVADLQYYLAIAEQGLTAAQIALGPSAVPEANWDRIATDIVASPEFAADSGGLVVPYLYASVLGRTPSGTELAYYQGLQAEGVTAATLLQDFVDSPEYLAKIPPDASAAEIIRVNESGYFGPAVVLPDTGRPTYDPIQYLPTLALTSTGESLSAGPAGNTQFYALLGGSTPTLVAGDSIVAGGTGNVLQIDAPTTLDIVLPAGLVLSGIGRLILNTNGNAGIDAATPFDLSPFALSSVEVISNGSGTDFIKAGAASVTDISFAGAVSIVGGAGVTLHSGAHVAISVAALGGGVTVEDAVPFGFIANPTSVSVTTIDEDVSIQPVWSGSGANASLQEDIVTSGYQSVVTVGTQMANITVGAFSTVSVGDNSATIDQIAVGPQSTVILSSAAGAAHQLIDVSAAQSGAVITPPPGVAKPLYVFAGGCFTTLQNAVDDASVGTLIKFDSLANHTFLAAAVDVSAATSEFDALSAAAARFGSVNANSAVVDWFQYGGNTYLLAAVNSGTTAQAHGQLLPTDNIVELTGLVQVGAHGGFQGGLFMV